MEDKSYQDAEFDAMLFAISLLVAPTLASRWSYVISGLSDVPQHGTGRSEHPLIPDAIVGRLIDAGACEALIYGDKVFALRPDGSVDNWRIIANSSNPTLEVSVALQRGGGPVTPFVGVLPEWAVGCDGVIESIVRDSISARRRQFLPVSGPSPAPPQRRYSRLVVVANAGDSTAIHLAHQARLHGKIITFLDLTHLYSSRCSHEQFACVLDEVEKAPMVFAR
ncbi:MAG: hypothetical protein ACREOG_03705, partial [Gemmatimonadaceae bacterium]